MGQLVNGKWENTWYETEKSDGKFVRESSQFQDWVRADGSTDFLPEKDRYHLYISLACPWACRTLIFRKLKKLEEVISLSIVDSLMGENGWEFSNNRDCIPDTVNQRQYLHQVYTLADPNYSGRVTVPVLWDKKTKTIVNNESSEIIRMLNREFNALTDVEMDYYPKDLQSEIDAINEKTYDSINNGVYRVGFATTQTAYEEAFDALFHALDELEIHLSKQHYLVDNKITEADWRLFTTLVRFDAVYVGHFKCNLRRIGDYDNIQNYLRELYQYPGISETVNMTHIKSHYYRSHSTINPNGIVPKGPLLSLETPHNRDKKFLGE